jgi:hypothetical protein
MSNWQVIVNDDTTLTDADGLYDVLTVNTFNPFGDFAKAFFDDLEGSLFDTFTRGTKVEFQYENDNTSGFETDFIGYVVSTPERESAGAERLEVEAYSFDQFLRGNTVSTDLTGSLISDALETVITEDVPPVSFDATQVDVVDDQELTESYQGDTVEQFLLSVRAKSGNELPRVDPDLSFGFERAELTRTARDIGNGDWVTHDLGIEGGETRNRVTVNYANGNESVQVDNSSDQLGIARNLGAAGPGVQGDSITRPKITNVNDAIAAGEEFLQGRQSSLTGSVTTTDLNDAEPGQVVNIIIEARGIRRDFRIAENRTRWLSETNELVVVTKKGADDDILIEQSQTLKRVSNRDSDPDNVPDITTDTKPTASVSVNAEVQGSDTVKSDVSRFVNEGRNALRDAILAGTSLSQFEMVFSASTDRPIRSDSAVSGPTEVATVENFDVTTERIVQATDTQTVQAGADERNSFVVIEGELTIEGQLTVVDKPATSYETTPGATDVRTIGLRETVTGDLIALSRLETEVATVDTAQMAISFGPTAEETSTITRDGLEFLSQVIAGLNPSFPATYAYGSGDTDPTIQDTDLVDQIINTDFNEVVVQDLDTQTQWESNLTLPQDEPGFVQNGNLQNYQSNFVFEAEEDFGTFEEAADTASDGRLTGFGGIFVEGTDTPDEPADSVSYSFTNEYDWTDWTLRARRKFTPDDPADDDIVLPELIFEVDGQSTATFINGFSAGNSPTFTEFSWASFGGSDDIGTLAAGSHTITIRVGNADFTATGSTNDDYGEIDLDVISIADDEYNYFFDNTVNEPSGFLDGPELFPDVNAVDTVASDTVQSGFDRARLRTTWNDTTGDQFIAVSADGSTFVTADNTQLTTETIGDTTQAFARFGISRFAPQGLRDQTPRLGYASQTVDDSVLAAIGDNIRASDIGQLRVQALIPDSQANGQTFAEAGLKAEDGTLLTRSLIPAFEKSSTQSVFSSELLGWQNEDAV